MSFKYSHTPPKKLDRRRTLVSEEAAHLIVIGAVSRFLHGGVLLVVPDLHADHWVHVEAYQLPRLDHRDADLDQR